MRDWLVRILVVPVGALLAIAQILLGRALKI